MHSIDHLRADDPVIASLVEREHARQAASLNLIAAESTAPESVLEALGSSMNNKAVEGYPGRRFHRGCEVVDEMESIAIERAKALFGAGHANVQPHSGVNANMAVYQTILKPGDHVLAMSLSQGGHLSHGAGASITGSIYNFRHYSVRRDTELIDYDEVRDLARSHRPRLIIAGGSSYPRLIDYGLLRSIADEVSALFMVDMAHVAGLVAAGLVPSPVAHAQFVTTTFAKTLIGPRGGMVLCGAEHAKALDRGLFPGTQGSATMNQIAAKAVCLLLATTEPFRATQASTMANAAAVAHTLRGRGHRLVAGGTDNHLVLVDLRPRGLTGARAEAALEATGIIVNRNAIPYDPQPVMVTSGIRLGGPGPSLRGLRVVEMREIAGLMDEVLVDSPSEQVVARARSRIGELLAQFPLWANQ
jgi:glycine hydroxymethyltransferase